LTQIYTEQDLDLVFSEVRSGLISSGSATLAFSVFFLYEYSVTASFLYTALKIFGETMKIRNFIIHDTVLTITVIYLHINAMLYTFFNFKLNGIL
jgi:hypothetical protein